MNNIQDFKKKSFWKRPEGVTGMLFLAGLAIGGGVLVFALLPLLSMILGNVLYLSVMLLIMVLLLAILLRMKCGIV